MIRKIELKKSGTPITGMSFIFGGAELCMFGCGCYTNCGTASESRTVHSQTKNNSGLIPPPPEE
jgi:hypothetical protein